MSELSFLLHADASRARMTRAGTALLYVLSSLLWLGGHTNAATAETTAERQCACGAHWAQEKAAAKAAGSEFKECAVACPLMVVIPPGKFAMGSPDDEVDRTKGEGPRHEVTITRAFGVSKSEVTFEQWDVCVAAAACPHAVDGWGRGTMPVIDVSWDGAKRYVTWLSRVTGKEYRLITEAEWEYAARAGTSTRYSWGDEPGIGHANCNGCGSAWILQTAPVGSFQPNAFGLLDMQGNVWEWVEDVWHDGFEGAPVDGTAWLEGGDANFGVVRGDHGTTSPNSPAPPSGSSVTGRFSSTRLDSE